MTLKLENFDALKLSLASPDTIMSWSHGEVTKPETINYRTLRPERDGLFCERIFGPTRDWECHCGKYKRYRYKGIICDKCGVEVTRSKVRRERMGHIKLASPVSHVWYFKGIPSRMGLLLDMSPRNLEKILYFANYIVTDVYEEARKDMLSVLNMDKDERAVRLRADIEAKSRELRQEHEGKTKKLKSEVEAEVERLEGELQEAVDELTTQGKKATEHIKAGIGTKSRRTMAIGLNGDEEVVIDKGDVLSREMSRGVLAKVQEKIEKLEANTKAAQKRTKERVDADKKALEAQIEAATKTQRDAIQGELEALQQEIEASRSDLEGLHPKQILTDTQYRDFHERFGRCFRAGIGAEAVRDLLSRIDLLQEMYRLREESKSSSGQRKQKAIKRLKVTEDFRKSNSSPTWMVLEVLPVIPPELRPMVQLDGGRFATSDLNDLYRRVINRNNRLKRLLELGAPEIIVRNEKRMLQEAVDALFDNGRRGRVITGPNKRPLKSLSDTLKGKQGRFRQNLLGKRVDYSGRSVIVVGPYLKLHQCGLPKKMALELFKPFILRKLEDRGIASSIKAAKKYVEKERPEVWDILEDVIKEHPILLNRAPTLHRLGIQAFEPILVEGKAIEIHPLVCTAFNADFDGDQMAVHVPLSMEAQMEAQVLMLSANNILSPSNGAPVAIPTQDMVFGIYYLSKERAGAKGEGRLFSDPEEVRIAYDNEDVDLQARIRLRWNGGVIETTVGRTLLNDVVPPSLRFINKELKKKEIGVLIADCYNRLGNEATVAFLDELKDIGFRYATLSCLSIGIEDMHIPSAKGQLIDRARQQVNEVEQQYQDGVITNGERYNKVVDIWAHVTEQIADAMFSELERGEQGGEFNPIYMMADSGARGSKQQIRQLAGMRGLMAKPSGEIIETPITSNFREGLTVLEYFTSTHGARKGLADTALKTADSGYLTRRLVDVSQDVIVSEYDCGTVKYIDAAPLVEGGDIIQSLRDRVLGRVAAEDIRDPFTGEIIVQAGTEINEELAQKIEDSGLERVRIRSALTCESKRGICVMCYGRNLGTGRLAEFGEAVGIIAAQSIGEPGTQLTMRTFHIGGTASRVVEASKHDAKYAGIVKYHNIRSVVNRDGDIVVLNRNGEIVVADERGREKERYPVVPGARIKVKDEGKVTLGKLLVEWDPFTTPILTEVSGTVVFRDIVDGVTIREEFDEVTGLSRRVIIEDQEGKLQPRVSIKAPGVGDTPDAVAESIGETRGRYMLPVGAHLLVPDGSEVHQGDIISKIPRETTKTKDITGGLPRVAELFEARKPKEQAVITEIDGAVEFAGFVKGMRKIVIRADDGETKEYLIPRGKHISVHEGDRVKAGEALMDGSPNP